MLAEFWRDFPLDLDSSVTARPGTSPRASGLDVKRRLADHNAAVRAAERDRVLAEVREQVKPFGAAISRTFLDTALERAAAALASASGTPEEGK